MSNAPTPPLRMSADWYDSVEVLDAQGDLEGYALVERRLPHGHIRAREVETDSVKLGDPRIVTAIYGTRSEPWVETRS